MYFFNTPLVEYAVDYFRQVDFADPAQGDTFWKLFAPGNTAYIRDRPFERLSDYEQMLCHLWNADDTKYKQMHKGTPFYIMSWLAFDLRNYKKALFYIDAAVSEDIKNTEHTPDPNSWRRAPGADFLRLRPDNMVARRAINEVRGVLERHLDRFNGISQRQAIDMSVIEHFVESFIDASQRTIISALYIFVMESEERLQELSLRRGSRGGSNEPFTVHLLTGGLLFESLLKHYYPQSKPTQGNNWTLGHIFSHNDFETIFKSLRTKGPLHPRFKRYTTQSRGRIQQRRHSVRPRSSVTRLGIILFGTTCFQTRTFTRRCFIK